LIFTNYLEVFKYAIKLAHEFGHSIYQAQNTSEYKQWLLRNPKEQNKRGHGKGDPSGKAADEAEKNFKN